MISDLLMVHLGGSVQEANPFSSPVLVNDEVKSESSDEIYVRMLKNEIDLMANENQRLNTLVDRLTTNQLKLVSELGLILKSIGVDSSGVNKGTARIKEILFNQQVTN